MVGDNPLQDADHGLFDKAFKSVKTPVKKAYQRIKKFYYKKLNNKKATKQFKKCMLSEKPNLKKAKLLLEANKEKGGQLIDKKDIEETISKVHTDYFHNKATKTVNVNTRFNKLADDYYEMTKDQKIDPDFLSLKKTRWTSRDYKDKIKTLIKKNKDSNKSEKLKEMYERAKVLVKDEAPCDEYLKQKKEYTQMLNEYVVPQLEEDLKNLTNEVTQKKKNNHDLSVFCKEKLLPYMDFKAQASFRNQDTSAKVVDIYLQIDKNKRLEIENDLKNTSPEASEQLKRYGDEAKERHQEVKNSREINPMPQMVKQDIRKQDLKHNPVVKEASQVFMQNKESKSPPQRSSSIQQTRNQSQKTSRSYSIV